MPDPVATPEEAPAEELTAVHVSEETLERFAKGTGEAMRSVRTGRRWTRKEMQHEMGTDRALQTLGTHELGTRSMSVCQFAEYCRVLGVQPGPMFDRVYGEVFGEPDDAEVTVDLDKLARSEHPNLARWAELRLMELPASTSGLLALAGHAQDSLAALCGFDRRQLLEILSAA